MKADFVTYVKDEARLVELRGQTIVAFSEEPNGLVSYEAWKQGIRLFGNVSVYDMDKCEYVVGNVQNLVDELTAPMVREFDLHGLIK